MYNKIIQAGMGIGVSNWQLANAVASQGHIGVVSSTEIDIVFVRRLQDGDLDGSIRRAMFHFIDQSFARQILAKYFISGGKPKNVPYINLPMLTFQISEERTKLIVLANFVEVYLAKEGHSGTIGINFLEKVQLPVLASLYGAMLAGVDCVFMGAGIPRDIPAILDKLAKFEDVEYKLNVRGATAEDNFRIKFSPLSIFSGAKPPIFRPKFYAIISSTVLALTLSKKSQNPVDGFVIESPTAGGHNAPPRGKLQLNNKGEPIYGERDLVDYKAIKDIGLPFWLAGGCGNHESLHEALKMGASGIQVGTAFALCEESGLTTQLKRQIIESALTNSLEVLTDPLASPTGFPFKVAQLKGSLSEDELYLARDRKCDLGYLRELYKKEDGGIGYRCASEPVDIFVKKGGSVNETQGRKCLCNGLMADIGLAQTNKDKEELPLVTIGDDVKNIGQFLRGNNNTKFTASDVILTITQEKNY